MADRHRRTRAEIAQLERQIYDVLEADNPQSLRHLFYVLTNPRLPEPLPKTEAGYKALILRAKVMRENETLPYSWLVDTSRMGYHVPTYTGLDDFAESVAGLYRRSPWQDASAYCEVWCESRSLAGVLRPLCRRLAVSLYPCGGYASLTFLWEAAQTMLEASNGRPVHVYYVGDYDAAGLGIDADAESKLRKYLPDGFPLHFERLAVTLDQIAALDLPTKPRKESDRRRLDIRETVEAESIPAATMRAMVEYRIEALLPSRALEIARTIEREERRDFVGQFKGQGSPEPF